MWWRLTSGVLATSLVLIGAGSADERAFAPSTADRWDGLDQRASSAERAEPRRSRLESRRRKPLRGVTIVLDPGHQLGNRNFSTQINRPVRVGGLSKPCNTTGTATGSGYPEATFNWQVAKLTRKRLRRLGARVSMTRTSNRADRWGPCVDVRGRAGNRKPRADLKVSIHADGNLRRGARGFHVIVKPGDPASRRLAVKLRRQLRGVLPDANYVADRGLSVRSDLGTLNLSRIPTVMVELGNMRHPADAALMTSPEGRRAYAKALVNGVRRHLGAG